MFFFFFCLLVFFAPESLGFGFAKTKISLNFIYELKHKLRFKIILKNTGELNIVFYGFVRKI